MIPSCSNDPLSTAAARPTYWLLQQSAAGGVLCGEFDEAKLSLGYQSWQT